ncbi:alpha/beta hydrolase [Phormidesmis priestleyi]
MLRSPQYLRLLTSKFAWFGSVLLMGVSAGIGHIAPAQAAERVILRYGIFQETFSVQDMQTFAETGELSRVRRFQLRVAGADPEVVREFLNQKLSVNFLTLDRTLNSLPGEFLLYQLGQVIYNRHRVAPVQSLRSAIVLSAREDNSISMLQFLQNYPLPEVFIDGKRAAEIGQKVGNTRARAGRYLETVTGAMQQILSEPLCGCEPPVETTEKP